MLEREIQEEALEAYHQLNESNLPVNVFNADVQEFFPHWYKRVEIVYALGEELKMGIYGRKIK